MESSTSSRVIFVENARLFQNSIFVFGLFNVFMAVFVEIGTQNCMVKMRGGQGPNRICKSRTYRVRNATNVGLVAIWSSGSR